MVRESHVAKPLVLVSGLQNVWGKIGEQQNGWFPLPFIEGRFLDAFKGKPKGNHLKWSPIGRNTHVSYKQSPVNSTQNQGKNQEAGRSHLGLGLSLTNLHLPGF